MDRDSLAKALYEADHVLNSPKGTVHLKIWYDDFSFVKDRYYRMADYVLSVETMEHGSKCESESSNLGQVGDSSVDSD